jgi:hypothetical protein
LKNLFKFFFGTLMLGLILSFLCLIAFPLILAMTLGFSFGLMLTIIVIQLSEEDADGSRKNQKD